MHPAEQDATASRRHPDRSLADSIVRHRATLLLVVLLAACSGPSGTQSTPRAKAAAAELPQIPPVEFGKRPPGTRITSENMPYFDTVKYCEWATRKKDSAFKGPLYEQCVSDQHNTRQLLGKAIDAKKFTDAKIVHCAKASRTAYHGMWYCLWDQPYR